MIAIGRTIAFAFVLAIGGAVTTGCERPDPQKIRREIDAAIPSGSTKRVVSAYLSNRGSDYLVFTSPSDGKTYIQAMLRDHSRWQLIKLDYRVVFRFDGDDRLSGDEVKAAFTGP